MNSSQIANELARAKTTERMSELSNAMSARQRELRERMGQISPSSLAGQPNPPEYEKAARTSPEALLKIKNERDMIEAELSHLARLEVQAIDRHGAVQREQALAEGRAALPKLAGNLKDLKAALKRYDTAVSAATETLNAISAMILEGGDPGWTDDDIFELAQLREQTWTPRNLPIPGYYDNREKYPKSWPLLFTSSPADPDASRFGYVYHDRRPPQVRAPNHGEERFGDWAMADGDERRYPA